MTVTTTSPRASYAGNGSTVLFTVPFLFPANADLRVVLRDASNVETLQVLTTNYTVTGAGNPAGGSITMGVAPATGETLVIRRVVALTQGIDYTPNDPFPADTHEQGLDRGMMAAQQLDESLGRALSVPESDTAASLELPIDTARASKFLSFDATGKPIAAAGTSANLGPVSAFMDTLLDDADAGTARATLGAAGTAIANTFTKTQSWSKGADVASAATLVLGTDGNYFDVTGTTGITAITVAAGTLFMLQFDGALTIADGASLDLAGANITTVAGDRALFFATAANTVQLLAYVREGVGPLAYATQAEQETGTATNVAVSPGRQHHHPSAAKCWGDVSYSGGVPTLDGSYNITSVTDTGAGILDVTIATDFSSAVYPIQVTIFDPVVTQKLGNVTAQAVGTFTIKFFDTAGSGSIDPDGVYFLAFGDQ